MIKALTIFFAFLPSLVFAAANEFTLIGKLVPRCDVDCNWTHAVAFVNNVLQFMVFAAVTLAGMLVLYAAYLYITAAGDSGKIKQGHSVFTHALIGLVIVLMAWLFVDTLLRSLTGYGLEYWSDPANFNINQQ